MKHYLRKLWTVTRWWFSGDSILQICTLIVVVGSTLLAALHSVKWMWWPAALYIGSQVPFIIYVSFRVVEIPSDEEPPDGYTRID